MAKLIYSMLASLDGYVADRDGNFGWAEPDEEVHTFVNDLARGVGTFLLGRRMYEVLVWWDDPANTADAPAYIQDFAGIWRAADKVVYSRSLEAASTERTRIEREFDPEAVRRMVAEAERDLSVGGPGLAAEAMRAGLVEEWHLVLAPAVVGGGTRLLPEDVPLTLELSGERRFASGMVYLGYRTA